MVFGDGLPRNRSCEGGPNAAQRIRRADAGARPIDLQPEAFQPRGLRRLVADEMDRMDALSLPDAIDASDSLLKAHRIPRQFDIDHQAAAVVQVQALTGCVGGDEKRTRIAFEGREGQPALVLIHPAVQDAGAWTVPCL